MFLKEESKGIIAFTDHTFTSRIHKSEELQAFGLEDTMQLIEFAKNNGISSFEVEVNGPLRSSPLNIELLNAHGIEIKYIKDKTPIPHNGCRIKKRTRTKEKRTLPT